jgi:hypothetical protein
MKKHRLCPVSSTILASISEWLLEVSTLSGKVFLTTFLSARPLFFYTFLCMAPVIASAEVVAEIPPAAQLIIFGYPHQIVDPNTLYPIRLLKAALEKSAEPFVLQASPVPMVQDRSLREISMGNQVDVFWSMTSVERERYLLPVRIPIDKGLFGWRLLLTTAQNQHLTESITTLGQMKKLVFLQGYDWPDTKILQSNRLRVITSNHYQSMFGMLASGRADIFPRSILEVWKEKKAIKHELQVDARLSIYYPAALYFFVSKSQPQLAARIEKGLNLMIASGEFEQLFLQEYGDELREAAHAKRHVIYLQNPLLPSDTPLSRKELWLDPDHLIN